MKKHEKNAETIRGSWENPRNTAERCFPPGRAIHGRSRCRKPRFRSQNPKKCGIGPEQLPTSYDPTVVHVVSSKELGIELKARCGKTILARLATILAILSVSRECIIMYIEHFL